MENSFEKMIQEAMTNADRDRDASEKVLREFMVLLKSGQIEWRSEGMIGAKYIEAMQRSNEQIVKLAGILSKKVADIGKEEAFEGEFTEDEFNNMYKELKK